MCGIAGFCNFENDFLVNRSLEQSSLHTLVQMRTAIAHRGNDQTGQYLRPHAGLSHTRLSIRDLSMGAQPIVRQKQQQEYAIVYNGEIYNAQELTLDLKSKGYEFHTTTDTEVILYAYMEYGESCVKLLNGIFNFAIWDDAKEKLLLFRDRMGVKPLFYTVQNGLLVFGSEIKAIFAHPQIKPVVDIDSFREVFGIGPARTGGCGVFKNIREIEAGWYAVFDQMGIHHHLYWDLESHPHTDSYAQTVDTVSFLVRDAIIRQMISDVPVCSFLSGGIDSSIVTAVAADFMKKSESQLNTFSFDFAGNDKYFASSAFQPERDRPYVDIMLSCIDTNHTYLNCDEASLVRLLPDAMIAKDLPGMADIDASLLYFCRLVKEKNKVALTGECADEIFGGYPWFYRQELLEGTGFPWSNNLAVRQCLLNDSVIRRLELESFVHERYESSVKKVPILEGESAAAARRRVVGYLNIKWFMQTLLDRMDRASMQNGLEARVPFADHRIVEYVFNVPWEMKYQNGVEKALLRDACADLLPKELLYRKKSPYPKTYHPDYELHLKEQMLSLLSNTAAPLHLLIDKTKVLQFMEEPAQAGKPWFGQLMAAPQMIAYLLQINQWLIHYHPIIDL